MTDAYTLLADPSSPLSAHPDKRRHLHAHIVQSILLHGRIILSDSQALRSLNFRQLLTDASFRSIVGRDLFSIALRDNPEEKRLRDINRGSIQRNSIGIPKELYENIEPVIFLEQHTTPITWHYRDVATAYTSNIRTIFKSPYACRVLGDKQPYIADSIEQIISDYNTGFIGRDLLDNELFQYLDRCNVSCDAHTRRLINEMAKAPYVTNLPTVLDADPIYEPVDRHLFSLSRGADFDLSKCDEIHNIKSTFDLSSYVEGLASLTGDSVRELLSSAEAKSYLKIRDDVRTDNITDFRIAMTAYLERIDEQILKTNGSIRYQKSHEFQRTLSVSRTYANGTYGSAVLEGIGVVIGCPPFSGTLLNYCINKALVFLARGKSSMPAANEMSLNANVVQAEKKLAAEEYSRSLIVSDVGQKLIISQQARVDRKSRLDTIAGYQN